VENTVLTARGEERVVAWCNTVLTDDSGRVTATLSSGEDVTERKRTERALQASQAPLQAIVQAQADGVLVVNAEGVIVFANIAAESLLGHEAERLVGAPFELPILTGASTQLDIPRPDGNPLAVHMHAIATDRDGRPVTIVNLHDLTDRKRIEEERRVHAENLKMSLVEIIRAMGLSIEQRDPYTAGHQQRVARLAEAIARGMALPEDVVEGIYMGALIHDIGKIYPDSVTSGLAGCPQPADLPPKFS
jgi:PAS domain-containing protein